jgi:CxxC motif-containing protein (DUF1111 family)
VVPYATPEQRATFERGLAVAERRFSLSEGLGPAYNVTFCGACHERPVVGGGAGLYRNFFLGGRVLSDGTFAPAVSADNPSGVIRIYSYGEEHYARPEVPADTNTLAQRNPIPFFGVGLLAELDEDEILRRADPDDLDGDGISGRPNYDQGFVGRFGMKAQTVSIEGFIRGPLFNHLGITSDPLSEAQKAALPVDSSSGGVRAFLWMADALERHAQASAPTMPLVDDDGVSDPELSSEDLFDLVSFAMLVAVPEFDITPRGRLGMAVFDRVGCADCHAPRLHGPRGPIPVYSDLLLHDMGPELADGIQMKEATGSEFRTQPLWGLSAVGPYLHDGRAATIEEAILHHAGEATGARDDYRALSLIEKNDLKEFLFGLGGRSNATHGLLPLDATIPEPGEYGGPARTLNDEEMAVFTAGRALFDREFGFAEGVGQPRFNGDSCRACHFEPVLGGAGPRGVNVMRHGILNEAGEFTVPAVGTIIHRQTTAIDHTNLPQESVNVYEHRQTPHLFGLGLIESIPDEAILANADPDDLREPFGISGKASFTDGGLLGRLGWKAQVPSIAEFVRDAVFAEMGMTLEYREGFTFGRIHDTDDVLDPEFSVDDEILLGRYLALLGPPPRQEAEDPAAVADGEVLFSTVGCASCHVPSLPGGYGPVPLYSDLLLHEILEEGATGIEDASANVREFRTAPLWGISQTAPYLHSGRADTIEEAIEAHAGEASTVRDAFLALSETERAQLLAFLETL